MRAVQHSLTTSTCARRDDVRDLGTRDFVTYVFFCLKNKFQYILLAGNNSETLRTIRLFWYQSLLSSDPEAPR